VPTPRAGAIIVHGLGLHPDWGLINTLRSRLPEQGYATLSIQMPVLAAEAKPQEYAATFPEATDRLRAAVAFLQARKIAPIAIVAHSMGARMTNEFLAATPQPGVAAWVSIGLSGALTAPRVHLPVLDLYGERDLPAVLAAAPERAAVLGKLPGSAQVQVSGADHFFNDREAQLLQWVTRFLDRALGAAQR
jgi:pimeloyl-ACP methyl ester carboxylesterase